MTVEFERIKIRSNPILVPQPLPEEPGLFQVDATWGTIQPMQVAEDVETTGELDVLEHLERGLAVVDARTSDFYVETSIPGAVNIPYSEMTARMAELYRGQPAIFFCNGPQCGQSPAAIRTLLEAGYPPDKVLYYRGGMHDWLTLGLPVVPGVT